MYKYFSRPLHLVAIAVVFVFATISARAQQATLNQVSIVAVKAAPSSSGNVAAELLSSEVSKRTGLNWQIVQSIPASGDVIILKTSNAKTPAAGSPALPLKEKSEAYRIYQSEDNNRKQIVVEGYDDRGVLAGASNLLRIMQYQQGAVSLQERLSISTAPDKGMRGHQLGYRNTANSWDGWTKDQFEQYIRDLVVFGTNSIESIPIFDESTSPHFKVPPMEMNSHISAICQKYLLDYWMWIPAQFDLADTVKRNKYLATFQRICKESVRINGVFFPGGDPGDNSPVLVIPLLKDLASILKKYHPQAKTWISLQGFSAEHCEYVYKFVRDTRPTWLGGIITGPSSPTAKDTRGQIPASYQIRHYPDLTHNVRCEFEIPWWDPAFNLTLGRESVNPRPYHYAAIYQSMEPYIDGFISYSDGVHDDVNKNLWTLLAWDRNADVREIMKQYANYFFGSSVREDAADGILALEKNWQGPIVSNGGVTSTLKFWQQLETANPKLAGNWRWQMNLLRAYYDAYTRERFVYETELELAANRALLQAASIGSDKAMELALQELVKAEKAPVFQPLKSKIIQLCEDLYQSIQLQTSVAKYKASGLERGAVLDYIDRPLNNRWWLEDQFKSIKGLKEKERVVALEKIANWETPGPGSFYDEVGNIAKSPHALKGESWLFDPQLLTSLNPGYDFSDQGLSRKRISWLTNMRWPRGLQYVDIDTSASYTVKVNGVGECLLKINGQRVAPSHYGREVGEIKEFPVPADLIRSGKLLLTWDDINEEFLNWRKQSRISEVWLIKENDAKITGTH